jgi:hypothetical protein
LAAAAVDAAAADAIAAAAAAGAADTTAATDAAVQQRALESLLQGAEAAAGTTARPTCTPAVHRTARPIASFTTD